MSTPATCTLTIDGRTIPDTTSALGQDVTALDGLTIAWGRESALDQPKASTMSARLAIPVARARKALADLTVGLPVTVTAGATTVTTSSSSLITDLQQARADWPVGGTRDRVLLDTAGLPVGRSITLRVAPGPLQQQGRHPDAWDTITRADATGGTWHLALTVDLPTGMSASLRPVYYTGPWDESAQLGEPIATSTGDGTLAGDLIPPTTRAGQWIGLALTLTPTTSSRWTAYTSPWTAYTTTWQDAGLVAVTAPSLTAPSGARTITQSVFAGTITDITAAYSDAAEQVIVSLTAADVTATLANMRLGDEPWPQQLAAARVAQIRALIPNAPTIQIDDRPAAMALAARDVDSVTAQQLLEEVATSTGAVLWAATHASTGVYIRLEDPTSRPALLRLAVGPDGNATTSPDPSRGLEIPAAYVLQDSAALTRGTSDTASSVSVRWKQAGMDSDGNPTQTERIETITDPDTLAQIGYRSVSVSTSLATQADAQDLASRLLALTAPTGWVIPALAWDTARSQDAAPPDWKTILGLLDATTRIGRPVYVTGLPAWQIEDTLPGYLEGGTYTYSAGRWTLDLRITRPTMGEGALTWAQTPTALTWAKIPQTWADLGTVTA